MILRILIVVIVVTFIIFLIYLAITGAFSRAFESIRHYDNPFNAFTGTSTGGAMRLPGQPDELFSGVDISQYAGAQPGSVYTPAGSSQNQTQRLSDLQNQYDDLYQKVKDSKNFGNPSPYRNKVSFGYSSPMESSTASEYITLTTGFQNTAPISLAGWSLQSAVTGTRVTLPQAAPAFISGILNTVMPVSLDPGSSASVVTGPSPVGVSFRENHCTGYLGDLQTFVPELQKNCPSASDELSLNADNIRAYGDACVDFAESIPQCHFPGPDPAPAVSAQCRNFLLNRFSYNGCAYAHRADEDFLSNSWRLYLASGAQLWRDTHDVVRLLDAEGRTVDVLTY